MHLGAMYVRKVCCVDIWAEHTLPRQACKIAEPNRPRGFSRPLAHGTPATLGLKCSYGLGMGCVENVEETRVRYTAYINTEYKQIDEIHCIKSLKHFPLGDVCRCLR